MKCHLCHSPITAGEQQRKRAEYRQQGDGTLKVFGHGMPGGPLAAAAGRLVKVAHAKCYFADLKKDQAAARLAAARAADSGYQPKAETDWRSQETVNVEEL